MASQHNEQSFESDNEVLPLLPEIEDLESLYFNDGSLLLISPEVRTQVHSSVLGRRSTIFHSVWETALNTPFIKTLKVYVTDSKEDLVRYTNAVYNIRSDYASKSPLRISVLGSLLRMSRKYFDRQMRDDLAARIQKDFPNTLKNWEEAQRHLNESRLSSSQYMEFELLNVVRSSGLKSALPALLYRICQKYNANAILHGLVRDSGTPVELPLSEKLLCLDAKAAIIAAQAQHTLNWVLPEVILSDHCVNKLGCSRFRQHVFVQVFGPTPAFLALEEWRSQWIGSLCVTCMARAGDIHQTGRLKLWNDLPSFFGLKGWDEISADEIQQFPSVQDAVFSYHHMVHDR